MHNLMKTRISRISVMVLVFIAAACAQQKTSAPADTLKDAFSGIFFIGTALNTDQITAQDQAAVDLVVRQFNSIVAENCMKSEILQPQEGVFDFNLSDQFVEFGQAHNMHIVGHTLIWHSQAPRWFFTDEEGNDVSAEVLRERMRSHIYTVVGRYKGKVHGWDVVNEAILDNGEWRPTKFYQILGEDYVRLAFEFAREADPDAELYYNDYSMALPGRREGVVSMVKNLQEQGIKVDGIGMQCHIGLDYPTLEDFEQSMLAFASLGAKVMITEMDISVLPFPQSNLGADVSLRAEMQAELNPYVEQLPEEIDIALNQRYTDFFRLFLKHKENVSRVTLWGVHDGQSWKNNWPVPGRTDYPLLFDRQYQPKPAVATIINDAVASGK
jgi:endo-1,4-beta-xylanase